MVDEFLPGLWTAADLLSVIDNTEGELEDFWYEIEYSDYEIPGIGTATCVEAETGGEGYGDDRETYVVFKVTDRDGNERLFRRTGTYASFVGTEWRDGLVEVEAYPKTITAYRPV